MISHSRHGFTNNNQIASEMFIVQRGKYVKLFIYISNYSTLGRRIPEFFWILYKEHCNTLSPWRLCGLALVLSNLSETVNSWDTMSMSPTRSRLDLTWRRGHQNVPTLTCIRYEDASKENRCRQDAGRYIQIIKQNCRNPNSHHTLDHLRLLTTSVTVPTFPVSTYPQIGNILKHKTVD